jgi:hypothetical protein
MLTLVCCNCGSRHEVEPDGAIQDPLASDLEVEDAGWFGVCDGPSHCPQCGGGRFQYDRSSS